MTTALAEILLRMEAVAIDDEAVAARERAMAAADAERERVARDARLRASGVPLQGDRRAEVVRGTLDLGFGTSIKAVVRWLALHDRPSPLVLQGGTGSGKSVAAAWALASLGGYCRSASQLAWTWQSNTVRAVDERDRLADCRLLVLDDIGTEHRRDCEWLSVALRDLFELRQRDELLTIITTNLSHQAWEQRYPDERIGSRLSRAAWVSDQGADRRRGERRRV